MAKRPTLKRFCWQIVLGFFCFVGFVLLVVFGVVFVRPYIHTSYFTLAQCRAVRVIDHGKKTCICARQSENKHVKRTCKSEYPCREIIVTFKSTESVPYHEGRLFAYYNSKFRTALCSVSICHQSWVLNREAVDSFVQKYGNSEAFSTYDCYYNPNDLDQIVLAIPTSLTVTLCMTLPGALVLITGSVLCCLCVRSRIKRNDSTVGGNTHELGNLTK